MKKLLIRLSIALIVLIILGILAISFFLDGAVKRSIETVGPMLTKVEVKLDSVNLSLLSGTGKIKGLFVGNPQGFKTPSAIQVGTARLVVQPGSLFSDKMIIKSINVQAPEITFETDLKGNNLSKILANLQAATGGNGTNAASPSGKAERKLQVDDFLIAGAKVHVSVTALGGDKSAIVPLADIHLTGLGQGPEGITAAELVKQVLQVVEKEAAQASTTAIADLGKSAAGLTKGLATGGTGAVDQVTKNISGLFEKK